MENVSSTFRCFFDVLNYYSPAVTAVSSIITAFFIVLGGILAWRKFAEYLKERNFVHYHLLIKGLVDLEEGKHAMREDRQVAVIFELQNYPSYREVTTRILEGLKENEDWQKHPKLIKEINNTLESLK